MSMLLPGQLRDKIPQACSSTSCMKPTASTVFAEADAVGKMARECRVAMPLLYSGPCMARGPHLHAYRQSMQQDESSGGREGGGGGGGRTAPKPNILFFSCLAHEGKCLCSGPKYLQTALDRIANHAAFNNKAQHAMCTAMAVR